ncbi:beta-1,4-N-acetylgalactosaminyltransferase bre-4-like [Clytia hemisphaerica]|uniref:beta-1,4-N-acetylgalactosaminyltransferase bre-4-like n=1 Tax=Clytia hemisphaerica TaxID=252671 RepID=UPI0034D392D1
MKQPKRDLSSLSQEEEEKENKIMIGQQTMSNSQGKLFFVVAFLLLIIIFKDSLFSINREYRNVKNIQLVQPGHQYRPTLSMSAIEQVFNKTKVETQLTLDSKLKETAKGIESNVKNSLQNILNLFTNMIQSVNETTLKNRDNYRPPPIKDLVTDATKSHGRCPDDFKEWYTKNSPTDNEEFAVYRKTHCSAKDIQNCSTASSLIGPLAVNEANVSLDWLYENELKFVKKGGWWQPEDCKPKQSTLIVIPFRNRELQLPILLRQLHPILKRQKLHYRILVVEQTGQDKFNRAKLFNIGFDQGLKLFPYQCFIVHDVDLLPENDKIDYGCQVSPKHLSAGVSTMRYILPYKEIFGGVSSLWSKHYRQVNGATNLFYGWGGEDDNLYNRLRASGLTVHRHSISVARYKMLKHSNKNRPTGNEQSKLNQKLSNSNRYFAQDGLNTLQYDLVSVEEKPLYTHVKANLRMDKEKFLF